MQVQQYHHRPLLLVAQMDVVGSRVPAKPSRFEHWGAREDLLPTDPRPSSLRSRGRTRRTHKTKAQDLYWFRTPLWCNTLLQFEVCGWPLGLMRNSTREEQPHEGLFLWSLSFCRPDGSISPLCGWLVLFIGEGPGPLPKY